MLWWADGTWVAPKWNAWLVKPYQRRVRDWWARNLYGAGLAYGLFGPSTEQELRH